MALSEKAATEMYAPPKQSQCYLTVYSHTLPNITAIRESYLNKATPFSDITDSLQDGAHHVIVSRDLLDATKKLVSLQSGQGSKVTDACHIVVGCSPEALQRKLDAKQDFRPFYSVSCVSMTHRPVASSFVRRTQEGIQELPTVAPSA